MLEFSLGLAHGEDAIPPRAEPLVVGDPSTGAIIAIVSPDAPPSVSLWRRMLARWADAASALYAPH
ncbi:MAG: hypothetical protein JO021_01300 [Alphaproteobacteria bacterium]|nr:hypothetical protein [Alphaproteobacteria bacterium]